MPEEVDPVVALLTSIDRRLALLAVRDERQLRRALETDLLKTDSRIAMFHGFDGERGSRELAELGNVGERSAQLFIKELLTLGLVREVASSGRTVKVERDDAAITSWYLGREDEA